MNRNMTPAHAVLSSIFSCFCTIAAITDNPALAALGATMLAIILADAICDAIRGGDRG